MLVEATLPRAMLVAEEDAMRGPAAPADVPAPAEREPPDGSRSGREDEADCAGMAEAVGPLERPPEGSRSGRPETPGGGPLPPDGSLRGLRAADDDDATPVGLLATLPGEGIWDDELAAAVRVLAGWEADAEAEGMREPEDATLRGGALSGPALGTVGTRDRWQQEESGVETR
eukprot:jgi/Mesvir1/22702/Mv14116-RA.1